MYFCKKSKPALKEAISLYTYGIDLYTQIKFHTVEEYYFFLTFHSQPYISFI